MAAPEAAPSGIRAAAWAPRTPDTPDTRQAPGDPDTRAHPPRLAHPTRLAHQQRQPQVTEQPPGPQGNQRTQETQKPRPRMARAVHQYACRFPRQCARPAPRPRRRYNRNPDPDVRPPKRESPSRGRCSCGHATTWPGSLQMPLTMTGVGDVDDPDHEPDQHDEYRLAGVDAG